MTSMYAEPDGGDLPPSQLVARRIRELIAGRQISGTKVAEAIDLDQRAFSRRYRGVTPWTVDELYSLATALGMQLSELLPRLDSNQRPFGSLSPQVSDAAHTAREDQIATVSRLFPGPPSIPATSPVPSPQPALPATAAERSWATSSRSTTTGSVGESGAGGSVVDLVTYRAGRNAGGHARRRKEEETA